jgi:hypothetical protein
LALSSTGKSILKFPWSVNIKNISSSQPSSLDCSSQINGWRSFLVQARAITVSIPSELADRLEQAYVDLRSKDELDEDQFSRLLNLAKYNNTTTI